MPKFTRKPTTLYLEATATATDLQRLVDIEALRRPGEWPLILSACASSMQNGTLDTANTCELFFVPEIGSGGRGVEDFTSGSRSDDKTVVASTSGGGSTVAHDEWVPGDREPSARACRLGVDLQSVSTGYLATLKVTIGWVAHDDARDC